MLKEAVHSLLNQSLKPSQIVIVDDCSTDGTHEYLLSLSNNFPNLIKYIINNRNMGVAYTRHVALKNVSCEYVTYLDGDDWFFPNKLESEAKAMYNSKEANIVFSNFSYKNKKGDVILDVWNNEANTVIPEGNIFNSVLTRKFPKGSLYKMELVNYRLWKQVGFHDLNLTIYEDYDMRIRLTRHLRAKYNDEILSAIRIHDSGLSNSKAIIHYESIKRILEKK